MFLHPRKEKDSDIVKAFEGKQFKAINKSILDNCVHYNYTLQTHFFKLRKHLYFLASLIESDMK